jgi:hypothetical protein
MRATDGFRLRQNSKSGLSDNEFLPLMRAGNSKSAKKTFDNEWVFEAFEGQPSFFTKRMFGGLSAYLLGRMMMILVEPTKTGRWKWHGVLVCTDRSQHDAIVADFPAMAPHDVLKKWLYIDSRHEDFESTMQGIAKAMMRNDRRFGIRPQVKEKKAAARKRR